MREILGQSIRSARSGESVSDLFDGHPTHLGLCQHKRGASGRSRRSRTLTRCILVKAETIAPKAISLDAAARAVVAACSFQVQAQRSALLAKSPGYRPQVRAELDKLEREHLDMAKEQVLLNRGR